MELYFLRHGEADWPNWTKPDDDRPLTDFGKKEVRQVAKFLDRLKLRPDLVVTSPLPRALQTAKIAAEHLKAKLREDGSQVCASWPSSVRKRPATSPVAL